MTITHSKPVITQQGVKSVLAVLESARLAQGAEVQALEHELAEMLGHLTEVVAVSSGTAALYLALAATGAKPGRKVIIPSYTCAALYAAVAHTGAEPICADVGKDAVVISPETVAPHIGPDVAAIVAPHQFGFEADIKGLKQWGIPVIEDCAQNLGVSAKNAQPLGSIGDVAIFSFYATKLLPAGEGGACATHNPELASRIRQWRQCDEQPLHPCAFNFKLNDIAAALARVQLQNLKKNIAHRNNLAKQYDLAFGAFSFRVRTKRPQPVCFRYLIEASEAIDPILKACQAADVACRKPVWEPLHLSIGGTCPETEQRHASLISVPIHSSLKQEDASQVIKVLLQALPSPAR